MHGLIGVIRIWISCVELTTNVEQQIKINGVKQSMGCPVQVSAKHFLRISSSFFIKSPLKSQTFPTSMQSIPAGIDDSAREMTLFLYKRRVKPCHAADIVCCDELLLGI